MPACWRLSPSSRATGGKVARLWTLDPNDPRALHPLAVGSWTVLLILTLIGVQGRWPPAPFWIVVVQATVVAAVFFALPRHQLLLAIVLVPVAGRGLALMGSRSLPWRQEPDAP